MSDLIRVSDIVDPAGPVALARAELRDRFAMAALTAVYGDFCARGLQSRNDMYGTGNQNRNMASLCYMMADAMLDERDRKP